MGSDCRSEVLLLQKREPGARKGECLAQRLAAQPEPGLGVESRLLASHYTELLFCEPRS